MKCVNCGTEVSEKEITHLEKEIEQTEARLYELTEKLRIIKAGYCDAYCEMTAEGDETTGEVYSYCSNL